MIVIGSGPLVSFSERRLRALGDPEQFIHVPGVRPGVKAGLVHVEFETVRPFVDGKGRLGRSLITFLLCADGGLR